MNFKMKKSLLTLAFLGAFSANANSTEFDDVKIGDPFINLSTRINPYDLKTEKEAFMEDGEKGFLYRLYNLKGEEKYQTIVQYCGGKPRFYTIGFYDFEKDTYYVDVKSPYGVFPDGKIDFIVKHPKDKDFAFSMCRKLKSA